MSEPARLTFVDGEMRVEGIVDFTSVAALELEGERWLREQAPTQCRLDLGGVGRCNSAATALLLSWLRTAHSAGKALAIDNVPETMRGLLDLAGLDGILTTHNTPD